jgi:hypothetical protein
LEGTVAYTPFGTFALIDVKVYPVQLRPEEMLTPEIRVQEDRKSLVFHQAAHKICGRCSPSPIESTAEKMPVLITRKGGTTKSIAWMAIGADRRATSERKTTPVNTSREIAASSLGCVGDARAGALGIKKERARLADSRCEVSRCGSQGVDTRTGK